MTHYELVQVEPGAALSEATLASRLSAVAPGVMDGVIGVLEQYADHPISLQPDQIGGVHVIVHDIAPGPAYLDETTWLGFHLSTAYPQADVYPHYVGRLHRRDLLGHGEGISECQWQGHDALQLSRRSSRWDPSIDTAALKALKVMSWLASR